jgi:hypothetical protein
VCSKLPHPELAFKGIVLGNLHFPWWSRSRLLSVEISRGLGRTYPDFNLMVLSYFFNTLIGGDTKA